MLKNYFIIAYRQIINNKLFSFINIGGLAIGLAACILIGLFVKHEYSYDKFWADKELIHRVGIEFHFPNSFVWGGDTATSAIKPELKSYFPELIQHSARFSYAHAIIKADDKLFEQEIVAADPELLDILKFSTLHGDLSQALATPNSVALSTTLAQKLFGETQALNKIINYQNHDDVRELKVTAIYQDVPSNSTYHFPAIIQLDDSDINLASALAWSQGNFNTLIKTTNVEAGVEVKHRLTEFVETKALLEDYWIEQKTVKTELMQMKMNALEEVYISAEGKATTIYLYQVVSLLILVIACFNFMNLSLARSTRRLKEVGLRKSLGASQSQIIWQFITETFVLALIALLFAIAIVEFTLPWYESLWGKDLTLNYLSASNLVGAFLLTTITAIFGGFYPALVSARNKPANVLTANNSSATVTAKGFRNLLVIAQFATSICLIICASVIYSQVQHSLTIDRGYDKEHLMILHGVGRAPVSDRQEQLKQELLKLPEVTAATYINMFPANSSYSVTSFDITSENGEAQHNVKIGYRWWDFDFHNVFEQKLLAGRLFDKSYSEDGIRNTNEDGKEIWNVIINESAVSHLHLGSKPEDAVNKLILASGSDYRVVGVVADTFYRSVRHEIEPEMYSINPNTGGFLAVKFKGKANHAEQAVKQFWQQQVPELPFVRTFVEDLASGQFRQEERAANLLFSSAILAAVIACLGLFGLATFTSQQRTKEIGIRKVYGANQTELLTLLVWQFSKPVLFACAIGALSATIIMTDWLEQYPYRITEAQIWLIGLLTCALAFLVATATIAGNTIAVARANPVKALRHE